MLNHGDRLLLHSNGMVTGAKNPRGSLLRAIDARRELPLAALVESLAQHIIEQTPNPEEFTLLGLQFN